MPAVKGGTAASARRQTGLGLTQLSSEHRETLSFRNEPKAADVAPSRHAFLMIDFAVRERGQQREIELTDLGIFHGKSVENAVVRFNRAGPRGCISRFVAELPHEPGELLDFLLSALQSRMLTAKLSSHRRAQGT